MSDHITQLTLTQIGDVLKDDGIISNEDLEDGIQLPYSVIQDSRPLYALSAWGITIPTATLDKVQTVLVSEGLIPADSSNTAQHIIYSINYSANNQFAFSISKGVEI